MAKKIIKKSEKQSWQIKTIEYLTYLLVFLAPIFISKNHFLSYFSFPKAQLIIGITLLMTILYLFAVFYDKKASLKFTYIHIVLFIFLLVLTLSSILGIDVSNSFFGTFTQSINLILIYAVSIFAFIIGFLVRNNSNFLPRFLSISFVSSIIVALTIHIDILNSIFNIEKNWRMAGTLGNSSYAGGYLLFNIFFGVGLFLYYKKYWQKILIFLGDLFIISSPVFLNSRFLKGEIGLTEVFHDPFLLLGVANAAVLGIVVSMLFIGALFLFKAQQKFKRILGIVSLVILFFGMFFVGYSLVNPTSKLHQKYVAEKTSNRFIAWEIAERSFLDRPMLGSGFNNFSYNYQKYFNPDIFKKENEPEVYFNQPHNVFWEYLSNNGVLGLLSYISLLVFTFISLNNKRVENTDKDKKFNNIYIVLSGIILGYFVQNLFGFDTPVTYLMLFSLVGIAIGLSSKNWEIKFSEKYLNFRKIAIASLIITSFFSMFLFVFLPWKESKAWTKITTMKNIENLSSLRVGVSGISLWGGLYDSSNLANKFFEIYQKDMNKIDDKSKKYYLEDIKTIIEQLEQEIKKQPRDAFSHIVISQLADLYSIIDNKVNDDMLNKAKTHLQLAIDINPRNPEIYLIQARTYIIGLDLNQALLSMTKAIDIAPEYKYSYEVARKILEAKPDKDFEKYVNEMEEKFIK